MPPKQVTIHVNDDGTIDLQRFAEDADLSKVKQLVDGLRGSVDDLKTKAAKVAEVEKLGTPDQIATWKKEAAEAVALRDRITELEGKSGMTAEEKKELEQLRETAKKLKDYEGLDPEAARKAIEFQQRTEKERTLSKAFKAAGLNGEAALRLEGIRNLETRIQTEQRDGKAVELAQVKVGDEWQPLSQHVEREYGDFLPVLKPDAKPSGGGGKAAVEGARSGASGGNGGTATSLAAAVQQHIEQG